MKLTKAALKTRVQSHKSNQKSSKSLSEYPLSMVERRRQALENATNEWVSLFWDTAWVLTLVNGEVLVNHVIDKHPSADMRKMIGFSKELWEDGEISP